MTAASAAPTSRPEDGLYLPEGASLFTRLRLAVRALKILEKKPDDFVAAALFNASVDTDVFARHVQRLLGTDTGATLLREAPSLQARDVDLAALTRLPDGTVGREFARYFEKNGIAPFESPYEVRNPVDYLVKWYRETHDLHHLLTGYATDSLGEMEVQAFVLGNLGLKSAALILFFAAVARPHGLPPIWKYTGKLRDAYRRGKASRNLFDVRYDRFLEEPVEALQTALHIPPAAA